MMQKKCSELAVQPAADEKPEWSARDLKNLKRLVRKHGVAAVSDKAKRVTPRGPGRPPRGDLPDYEAMHEAEWIEEQTTGYKLQKLGAPLKRAFNDAYEMTYGEDPDRPDPGKYAKTLKRKYYPALRNLRRVRDAAERSSPSTWSQRGRGK